MALDRSWHRDPKPHRRLRRGHSGEDVRAFQAGLNRRAARVPQHLRRNLNRGIVQDGEFGPATLAAWREVRYAIGLPSWLPPTVNAQRNVVDPSTRSRAAVQRARKRRKAPAVDSRARVVAHARSFIGTTERPPGSNSGGIITTWERNLGFGPVPWCGIFAGNMLRDVGVVGVTSRIAGVALIEEDAKSASGPFTGWTTDAAKVRPGDLVVLFGFGVHVEIVERVDRAGGVVFTVGGNTSSGSSGSQSNGGGVFARARALSDVRGFALVRFP